MTPAEIIAREPERVIAAAINTFILEYTECSVDEDAIARAVIAALTSAGIRLIGPDDAKLIETALTHASFALDGVVALDDEDEGKDGGSDTCQHAKRTVDRALKRIRALADGGESE